jgi:hypothetical protein
VRKKITGVAVVILLMGLFLPVSNAQERIGPPVDVVFCLDLSNSANGLIDQFRNHLWDYWYFFSKCNPRPNFRIAVVTYARFSHGKSTGYTRVVKNLGTDFERLSNLLFKIPSKIEKGDQYVGSALQTCLKKISWSKDPAAKKIIFLVGNGEVTLGPDDVDKAVDNLVAENIQLNTIYCTAPGEQKAILGWQQIAVRGGGTMSTMSIRNFYFDSLGGFNIKKLRYLNRKLNNTYLFYGNGGRLRWKMLQEEDNHVYVTNTEGYRYRSLFKISGDYQNKNHIWDLVDLYAKNRAEVFKIDRKLLNDTCKQMTKDQLRKYIVYKKYERKKLTSLIGELVAEKEKTDRENGINMEREIPTLDVICLRRLRDILKESSCECVTR